MNKKILLLYLSIFLLGLMVRVLALFQPIAGDFASYQMDNLWIAKFMKLNLLDGFLYPKSMSLLNGKPGLILLSCPIPAFVTAIVSKWTGSGIEFLGHAQAVLFSILSLLIFYFLTKKMADREVALKAAIFLWISPLFWIYGSKFFNEPMALFLLLSSIYLIFLIENVKCQVAAIALAGFIYGIAFILRMHFIFVLPAVVYLLWKQMRKVSWGKTGLFLYFFCALIPIILWFGHVSLVLSQGANVQSNYYVQSQIQDRVFSLSSTIKMLASLSFQKKIFDDIVYLHYTPILLPFIFFKLFTKHPKYGYFPHLWLLGFLLLVLVIPQKIYDHSFYAFGFIPAGVIFISLGITEILKSLNIKNKLPFILLVVFFVFSAFRYSFPPLFVMTQDERRAISLGHYIDQTLPQNAIVVAAHKKGSPILFYHSDRLGWVFDINKRQALIEQKKPYFSPMYLERKKRYIEITDIERVSEFKKQGATHLAIVDRADLEINKELRNFLLHKYRQLQAPKPENLILEL